MSAPELLPDTARRQRWMGLLARATCAELEAAWTGLAQRPAYVHLRRPESGLVMVRGRAGGSGAPFNLGEMTMTRCAVRLEAAEPTVGLSFVAGRDLRLAELAAVFDALLQVPSRRAEIEDRVLGPVIERIASQRQRQAADLAATRVEFFTLVRERDLGG